MISLVNARHATHAITVSDTTSIWNATIKPFISVKIKLSYNTENALKCALYTVLCAHKW
jgi:hypothetical protein